MTLLLAASLFFAHPAPLDMPRAHGYLVTEADGSYRLEDRFAREDLWTSQAVLGSWFDDDGRLFTVSRLDAAPPLVAGDTLTRSAYAQAKRPIDPKKDMDLVTEAISLLSPVEPATEPAAPRQAIRGFKDVLYYEGTNLTAVVCLFRRAETKGFTEPWYLASWELAEGDDREWARELFEKEILEEWEKIKPLHLRTEVAAPSPNITRESGKAHGKTQIASERMLLRDDARHSISNYPAWHVTEAEEFSVLDNLRDAQLFMVALTNDLAVMRKQYAEVMPGPVNATNSLCVARIYSDKEDYIVAAGEDMAWTAAYWNPLRRELVAYLPQSGTDELLKTIRHEAFHQYLSYATSFLAVSPWLNEGYAQYFEDTAAMDWKLPGGKEKPSPEELETFAAALPGLMALDYEEFYAGDDDARRLKYRLAWSIAVFIEKGAPKVRFAPFRNLKRDYLGSLMKTHDMLSATGAAFGTSEKAALFVEEWKKYWKKN